MNNSTALTATENSPKVGFDGAQSNSTCSESLDLAFWVLDGAVGVVILVGNILTCAVFLSSQHLRQSLMNIFLLSLAVSDLLMGLLVVPGFAAFCETRCQYSIKRWCWLFGMIRDVPFEAVILNLVAITYDRHMAVFRPLVYSAKMTKKRVAIILAIVWGLPFSTAIIRTAWLFSSLAVALKNVMDRNYNIFLIFVFVLLPALGVFIINLMIMKTIQKHRARINPGGAERSQSETSESERRARISKRKGTMACVLVVLVFFACWMPRIIYNFFYLAKRPDLASPVFVKFTMFFLLLQSCVNPFIYSFYRQDFRHATLSLLRLN